MHASLKTKEQVSGKIFLKEQHPPDKKKCQSARGGAHADEPAYTAALTFRHQCRGWVLALTHTSSL